MYILDTNIISELMRPRPNEGVALWVRSQPLVSLNTTAITKAELYYGMYILPDGKRKSSLELALNKLFSTGLENRILDFDSTSAIEFAKIAAHRKKMGIPISNADAQIASICKQLGFQLVTRNTSDFIECDIQVINPFTDQDGQ